MNSVQMQLDKGEVEALLEYYLFKLTEYSPESVIQMKEEDALQLSLLASRLDAVAGNLHFLLTEEEE